MGTFLHARREHLCVSRAALHSERFAAELWNAIVGLGNAPAQGSFAEAVQDTAPIDYAALLASDDVAAAFAFELMWESAKDLPEKATPFELRTIAREQWAAFVERAEQATNVSQGFGWSLDTAWAHVREVQIANGDMGKVERIARLAGRMVVALRGARAARVKGIPSEVYSVEQGNDIGRLLPSEQVLLTDPQLELVTLERIATRRAAQYAVRGTAKSSKGPLVVALDESGSMAGARNEWAKAAAVALARVASGDGRPVSVIHYSTSTVRQPLRPGDSGALMKMIQHFLGGGTAIALALNVAVDEVKALTAKGQKGADIILVSDGIDGNSAAQAEAVHAALVLGVRLWTVAIACEIPAESPLRSKAASYVRLGRADLSDERSVVSLVGAT